MKYLIPLLFLASCEPVYAKTFPGQWDGKCLTISEDKNDRYHVQNPDTINPYQKGYIPPGIPDEGSDVMACLDHERGPK